MGESETKRTETPMGTKRLTFEVPGELHSQLKSEAAELGVSLGSYCEKLLEGRQKSSSSVEELDATTISSMSMDNLREACSSLVKDRPKDWKRGVQMINTEIRRRFRV
jgi:hypothetical protein